MADRTMDDPPLGPGGEGGQLGAGGEGPGVDLGPVILGEANKVADFLQGLMAQNVVIPAAYAAIFRGFADLLEANWAPVTPEVRDQMPKISQAVREAYTPKTTFVRREE